MARRRPVISLLVPRRRDHGRRDKIWRWLRRYWRFHLKGDVEIVMGHDWATHRPFSKTAAVNDAARKAKGDIFVILDSDAYLPAGVVRHCAARIRGAEAHGIRLWFVPYFHLYRLTEEASNRVLRSNPKHPLRFPSPPDPEDVQGTEGSAGAGAGMRFGAMILIVPRSAFEFIGGMDERFRGWGGEDVSYLRALLTLWAPPSHTPNDVLHIWHPKGHATVPSPANQYATRIWEGQGHARANDWLSSEYNAATGLRQRMRALVEAGHPLRRYSRWHRR